MDKFQPTKYTLRCVATGEVFEDNGWSLDYPICRKPSLIRTQYAAKQLKLYNDNSLYKFRDWLPMRRMLHCDASHVTYKSEGLAAALGLRNLYITFNGYLPERGATMTTCSFKECEAYSVCARISDQEERVLVVASAGNTARAFAKVCSENNIKLLLVVPEDNLDALWCDEPVADYVKVIACAKGGDYYDAIALSEIVLRSPMFYAEGGAKNVARRDGMGTCVLSAVTTIGHIPDYYFQAVGSGTGAIAAWEANMRLVEDGRYGANMMRLMVSQNAPFLPIYNAWHNHSREMLSYDATAARRDAATIEAKVLSNRKPPYAIAGGLFDALQATNGDVLRATNMEVQRATQLFLDTENVDIHPAAAVAVATLVAEVQRGRIERDATIMLNITGGGERRYKSEQNISYIKPSYIFPLAPDCDDVITKVEKLFQ
ncbi:MAG: cysteate synthase [Alistipes sp.]|nr:cysteate synthase [Alistipes sp.]